jgi:hypothetical protein
VLGGYDDWFLPDITQLNWLYLAYTQGLVTGFYGNYCSSTQYSVEAALVKVFSSGFQGPGSKGSFTNVRAIRAF